MISETNINDNTFQLDPSGAVFWKEKSTLLIADVHLGKIAHFRKNGAAVPLSASKNNFEKLRFLDLNYSPETFCFLGDLFHSYLNSDWQNFEKWVSVTTAKIILISGNHDIISPIKFERLGIAVKDELQIEEFLLTHHPKDATSKFNICGHVHPGVKLTGVGRQRISLPCFYKTDARLILPAFGTFTGKHILSPLPEDEIFAIADGEVIPITN